MEPALLLEIAGVRQFSRLAGALASQAAQDQEHHAHQGQDLPDFYHRLSSYLLPKTENRKPKTVFKVAEREGFEPSVEVSPHTRLAGEHLRPLGHLSGRMEGLAPPSTAIV